MADFNIAVRITLEHEGGFVDNLNDSGGTTNFGITQADMPGQDMKTLTVEQAVAFYAGGYWKALYSQISSQAIANKLFDMGVLFGIGTAVKALQRALGAQVDGLFGHDTLALTNEAVESSLLYSFQDRLRIHALDVANANPNDRIFLAGWLRRVAS